MIAFGKKFEMLGQLKKTTLNKKVLADVVTGKNHESLKIFFSVTKIVELNQS